MKIKLTIITENNKPVELLGENPEEKIKRAWNAVLMFMAATSISDDDAYVENVEILRGENDAD